MEHLDKTLLVENSMPAAFRILTIALLLMASACAMRVTGIVTDATTRTPIGAAVLQAQDGRNRIFVTDPSGNYSVKTDNDTGAMIVSAPGYRTKVVTIGDGSPFVAIELERDTGAAVGTLYQHTTIADKLREVESLYSNGAISKEEYRAMRTRVIEGH